MAINLWPVKVADIGVIETSASHVSPFELEETQFVHPTAVAARIASQRGLFSVHVNPGQSWRLRGKTEKFVIDKDVKSSFRDYLFGLGVDEAMIMADLDGLAKNLNWRYMAGKQLI